MMCHKCERPATGHYCGDHDLQFEGVKTLYCLYTRYTPISEWFDSHISFLELESARIALTEYKKGVPENGWRIEKCVTRREIITD